MQAHEYCSYDAVALSKLVTSKQISAVELASAAIHAIESLNPKLNAVICTDYERGLRQAACPKNGPLTGVPFLLKDVNVYDEGMPTTFGSRFFQGAKPRQDSSLVERWRRGGLIILGKTNTPEFAGEWITEPRAYGITINPWNPGITVGGSSGGSAAAVASGMVPLAHATDSAGSIRIPAACCGLYGLKPTYGLSTAEPYFAEIATGLNSDHVVTRTVRDSAALLDCTVPVSERNFSYLDAHRESPGKLKILATVHDSEGNSAGPQQVVAVEQSAEILRRLGHRVTLVDKSPLVSLGAWYDFLWIADLPPLIAERTRELGHGPREGDLELLSEAALEFFARASAQDIAEAVAQKKQAAAEHMRIFDSYDILLTPTLSKDPAPLGALGFREGDTMESWSEKGYGFAAFAGVANIAGQPAASLPLPMENSVIPVGIQIMAAPHRDLLVLQLSAQLEEAFNWKNAIRDGRTNAIGSNSRSVWN